MCFGHSVFTGTLKKPFIIRLDADGNETWNLKLNGADKEVEIQHVIKTSAGDFLAVGNMQQTSSSDFEIFAYRFDLQGQ